MVFVARDIAANERVFGRAFQNGANPIVRYGVVNDLIIAGRLYGNALVIVVRGDIVQERIIVAGRA